MYRCFIYCRKSTENEERRVLEANHPLSRIGKTPRSIFASALNRAEYATLFVRATDVISPWAAQRAIANRRAKVAIPQVPFSFPAAV